MSKIFDFNSSGRGSYLNKVSGTLGVNTNGVFKKTEKGQSWLGNGVDTKILFTSKTQFAGDFTISSSVSFRDYKSYSYIFSNSVDGSGNNGFWLEFGSARGFTMYNNGSLILTDNVIDISGLAENIFHHIVIQRRGSDTNNLKIYIDNELIGQATYTGSIGDGTDFDRIGVILTFSFPLNGYLENYNMWDEVIDKGLLYKEFLAAQPIDSSPYRNPDPIKADDLSRFQDDGLVASYNMIPSSSGVLVDTSGNNENGINYNTVSTKNGMMYDGINSYSETLSVASSNGLTALTICLRVKFLDWTTNDGIISSRGDSLNGLNAIAADIQFRINSTAITATKPSLNQWYDIVAVWSGSTQQAQIYFNGILVTDVALTQTVLSVTDVYKIAWDDTDPSRKINMEVVDLKFYSVAKDLSFAKAYHNQFVGVVIDENFQNRPVGALEHGVWQEGTGTYEIKEDVTGNKWMENAVAGTIALQSDTAYGEWEFDIYKGADGNATTCLFIQGKIGNSIQGLSYNLIFNSDESIKLRRQVTVLFSTTVSYILINTWYRIKITRSEDGEFTVYIKGGSFGNQYVLVDVSGGSGANPVTNNSYTESNYLVVDTDAGDRIDNILVKNGIKQ